jgi:hypothetical protein
MKRVLRVGADRPAGFGGVGKRARSRTRMIDVYCFSFAGAWMLRR